MTEKTKLQTVLYFLATGYSLRTLTVRYKRENPCVRQSSYSKYVLSRHSRARMIKLFSYSTYPNCFFRYDQIGLSTVLVPSSAFSGIFEILFLIKNRCYRHHYWRTDRKDSFYVI